MYLIILFVLEIIGVSASVFIGCTYSVISMLWVLPVAFIICIPLLLKTIQVSKYSLFYVLFVATVFLRYIVHPVLIVLVEDYSEIAIKASITPKSMNAASLLMVYELLICTLIIYFINRKSFKREKKANTLLKQQNRNEFFFETPAFTSIYKIFIIITILLVIFFPRSLRFFSFAVLSLGKIKTASMSLLEQITVMFIITAKYYIYILLLLWCKKKNDNSRYNSLYRIFGLVLSIVFGCFYYGTNRMIFVFTFISALFLYRIVFKRINVIVIAIIGVLGVYILLTLTEARNYYSYYSNYSGIQFFLRSLKSLINAYLGGVTNVAVAIDTRGLFGNNASFGGLIIDLLRPIVGLNLILPVRDSVLSNAYFNYVFFGNDSIVSQIMPMIGYGNYYFGAVFAPLSNAFALLIFGIIEKYRSKTLRIELIYIFMTISMRLSMLPGLNLIIISNELSMQIFLPLIIYYINNKISLRIGERII